MSELSIGYFAVGSLFLLSLASLFYMWGGRGNKALRRFFASFIIFLIILIDTVSFNVFSFFYLLVYPVKIGEFCLGYGGHSMPRFLQRGLITLISCCGGLIFCLVHGGKVWFVLPLQAFVGLSTIFFAFKNPFMAAAEEPLVCFLNNLVFIFYPFALMV